ncbi:MAG: hypothetical protein Hyperionvirus18_45 [Hyperionvirus sp.]|uniref:Uncharacterized protein n=1 Tax=Hyperionvirus sp. TaxID=2487770 RepID=A0A3G5AFL3_9VIRU|nr:MAG: hypothetical protein Hyperionvirus18_45 [Hyperionvirus sp.]
MDYKCISCSHKAADQELLNQHELEAHKLVNCRFCVGRFTSKFDMMSIRSTNIFENHVRDMHPDIFHDAMLKEYHLIVENIIREGKRKEQINLDFVERWKSYGRRCYEYYVMNMYSRGDHRIEWESILGSSIMLNGFVVSVHKFHNKELLRDKPIFPGCKEGCTWTYDDDRCKCASKRFKLETDSINWNLWSGSAELKIFSIDHTVPIGDVVML